ncbi:endolytic transglycosylase MltG [Bacillus sp. ISL-51]|uniref:endolytic transglycosylase MltG n=1 Tax=unclassified Bacillus (in: firmicutes) TaxID=185979 RepID=UPI001BE59810|nr:MULTISPECIES: endolytic transglycosylase MltG [unclassified Bacillus (in: firmicutes)]MBT2574418.1 endolytic transglycosylase MltG [Bacillus sp. ISL-51]MBT2633235.1 endolytic transglycosylase MltG [Bacillus sp. ISL-26]
MTKRGIQAFAAGIILATAVLAAVFYLTDNSQASAVKTEKTALTEKEVNSYLDSQQKVSVNRDDYQKLLDSKEKSLDTDQNSDTKKEKKTYKLTIKDGMSTADVSSILEKEGIIPSAEDFNDYVIDAGYHKEIRAGHFKVDSGMSFKKLVKTLTR